MKQKKPEQSLADEPNRPVKSRNGPVQGTDARQALWSLGVVIAFAIVVGVTLFGINARQEPQTAPNPPPATASVSPSQGLPAETTGQGSGETGQSGEAVK